MGDLVVAAKQDTSSLVIIIMKSVGALGDDGDKFTFHFIFIYVDLGTR